MGTIQSGNLTATGATLFAQTSATGTALYNDITGLSGVMNLLVEQTGQAAWISANGAASGLSGQLTTTGQSILAQLSGTVAALSGQLNATGAFLTDYDNTIVEFTLYLGDELQDQINTGALYIAQNSGSFTSGLAATGAASLAFTTGASGALQSQISLLPTSGNIAATRSLL